MVSSLASGITPDWGAIRIWDGFRELWLTLGGITAESTITPVSGALSLSRTGLGELWSRHPIGQR